MKIAITDDCHLKSDDSNSERYIALKNILDRLNEQKIKTLIIAGDLFDKDANNFARFEKIISDKNYSDISILAIRGNHDLNLHNDQFTRKNFCVIDKPAWIGKDKLGVDFLFIPYVRNKSMAEIIEQNKMGIALKDWVLVCHGNFIYGNRKLNPYEQGVYMPLLNVDIQRYKPVRVFIGHIHKPYDSTDVIIPGSPCSIDITESGKRSIIIFDSTTLEYEREFVENKNIFLDEQLTVIPLKDEKSYIQTEIDKIFKKWDISDYEKKLVSLRMNVIGYSANLRSTKEVIQNSLKDVNLFPDGTINFEELKSSNDVERDFIINKIKDYLQTEINEKNIDNSLENEIEIQALNIVYE